MRGRRWQASVRADVPQVCDLLAVCLEAGQPPRGALRLVAEVSGDATSGVLGVVAHQIDLGIDRMLGKTEQLLRGEFEGGALKVVSAIGSRHDDRALLLVHRR